MHVFLFYNAHGFNIVIAKYFHFERFDYHLFRHNGDNRNNSNNTNTTNIKNNDISS